jgi:hypothetical protein
MTHLGPLLFAPALVSRPPAVAAPAPRAQGTESPALARLRGATTVPLRAALFGGDAAPDTPAPGEVLGPAVLVVPPAAAPAAVTAPALPGWRSSCSARRDCIQNADLEWLHIATGYGTLSTQNSSFGGIYDATYVDQYGVRDSAPRLFRGNGAILGIVNPSLWHVEARVFALALAGHLIVSPVVGFGSGASDHAPQTLPGTLGLSGGFGLLYGGVDVSFGLRWHGVLARAGATVAVRRVTTTIYSGDYISLGYDVSATDVVLRPRVAVEFPIGNRLSIGVDGGIDVLPAVGYSGAIYVGWHTFGFEDRLSATGSLDREWDWAR